VKRNAGTFFCGFTPDCATLHPGYSCYACWEHANRDDEDYAAHMDYVHFNPVKHGLVSSAAEWPYSTFKSCVDRGLYPEDWIGVGNRNLSAGELGEWMHSSEYA